MTKKDIIDAHFFRRNGFKKKLQPGTVSYTLIQLGRAKNSPPILYRITVHVTRHETQKGAVTGYLLMCIKSEYGNTPFRAFDGWISTMDDFKDVMRVVGIKRKFRYD